jgi:hypothetical protein
MIDTQFAAEMTVSFWFSQEDFTLYIKEVGSSQDFVSVLFSSINLSATNIVISSVTFGVSDSGFKLQSTSAVFTLKTN